MTSPESRTDSILRFQFRSMYPLGQSGDPASEGLSIEDIALAETLERFNKLAESNKIQSQHKNDIAEIFGERKARLEDYFVCFNHANRLGVHYVGDGPTPINPRLISPQLISWYKKDSWLWYCEQHRAEMSLKNLKETQDIKTRRFFVVPRDEEFGNLEELTSRINAAHEQIKVIIYKEQLPTIKPNGERYIQLQLRQAVILATNNTIPKEDVLQKLRTLSRPAVENQVYEHLQTARQPISLTPLSRPEIFGSIRPPLVSTEYMVVELGERVERPAIVNAILGLSLQMEYRVDPDNPHNIRFYGDMYMGKSPEAGTEREYAIKGIYAINRLIRGIQLPTELVDRVKQLTEAPGLSPDALQELSDMLGTQMGSGDLQR